MTPDELANQFEDHERYLLGLRKTVRECRQSTLKRRAWVRERFDEQVTPEDRARWESVWEKEDEGDGHWEMLVENAIAGLRMRRLIELPPFEQSQFVAVSELQLAMAKEPDDE